jgi:hypothetical protein
MNENINMNLPEGIKPEDIKLIIEVIMDGNRIETLYLETIEALNTTKWDGYRLHSIKIFCELTSLKEVGILLEFLSYQQYCFDFLPATLKKNETSNI